MVAVLCYAVTWAVRQMRKIRGPVVQGTAEVLSLRQFGTAGGGSGVSRAICRLRLRVSAAGREPYDVTVWRNIPPWDLGTFYVGNTVDVEVSESNPKKLQFGRSRSWPTRPNQPIVMPPADFTFNAPPKVTFNQSSWSPETGWTGSPPPGGIADQIKAALEGAFQQNPDQARMFQHSAGAAPVLSAAELLATGQRVPAALKSFSPTGTTPRSLGRTPSRPELIDAPHYVLEVELHFPNLAPITAQAVQAVPMTAVSSLRIGLPLTCAVDPADPSRRFVVDWSTPQTF
jgi:hypothetical protein